MLVVDASVLARVVADGGEDGDRFRARVRGERLIGPDLLRIEVLSVIRRHGANGTISKAQATRAIDDLLSLPLVIYPTGSLLRRVWGMRQHVSAHDACYVALAEALDCPLLTADRRLAQAPGTRVLIELV